MDFKLSHSKISDLNIFEKIVDKIDLEKLDSKKIYDISIEYYNEDLVEENLNNHIIYEIKPEHLKFIKTIRKIFNDNNININNVYLFGTIVDVETDELVFSIINTKKEYKKENVIWPCKEVFLYDGNKKILDNMLESNQMTLEEYLVNLEVLQNELGIIEVDEESKYIN